MRTPEGLIGTVLNDTYRIDRLLGEGGMGVVYQAVHLPLDRPCAVKVLHPAVAADPEGLARFRQEARIISSLDHPNLVRVTDFNQTPDGLHFFVMDLLQGESLAIRIHKKGRLGWTETLVILGQVASVLNAVHEQGIIHRDLKPQNIFLCLCESVIERVKLLDFGISKLAGSQITALQPYEVQGTPYYLAPEQVDQSLGQVSLRTDVYALGVILYEMLSGRPPFTGDSVPALAYQIVRKRPPPLHKLRQDIPAEMAGVVNRALRKRPHKRFRTVAQLWESFSQAYLRLMPAGDDDTVEDRVLIKIGRNEEETY